MIRRWRRSRRARKRVLRTVEMARAIDAEARHTVGALYADWARVTGDLRRTMVEFGLGIHPYGESTRQGGELRVAVKLSDQVLEGLRARLEEVSATLDRVDRMLEVADYVADSGTRGKLAIEARNQAQLARRCCEQVLGTLQRVMHGREHP